LHERRYQVTAWAGKHAKLLTATAGAVLSVVTQVYGAGNHWLLAVTAAATAFGVYVVPNSQGGPRAKV
jgi:hypothetical protein